MSQRTVAVLAVIALSLVGASGCGYWMGPPAPPGAAAARALPVTDRAFLDPAGRVVTPESHAYASPPVIFRSVPPFQCGPNRNCVEPGSDVIAPHYENPNYLRSNPRH